MIYLTQFIFVKEGKESIFYTFEDHVLPLLEKFNGKLIYRIRAEESSFITCEGEKPHEIHFVSFKTELDFQNYMQDERRKKYISLKDESVNSILLIKGTKM